MPDHTYQLNATYFRELIQAADSAFENSPFPDFQTWSDYNLLNPLSSLNNRYFGLRHGQSFGNTAGILVGNPLIGCKKYGVTPTGKTQVKDGIESSPHKNSNLIIVASDFLRTDESAEVAAKVLGIKNIFHSVLLRERGMGELDMKPDVAHREVLQRSIENPFDVTHGVESCVAILYRATTLIAKLEAATRNQSYLLVSHRDTLEIIEAAFKKSWPAVTAGMLNGELREFTLN